MTDLETPQITTIDVEATIQLAKYLQGQLEEPQLQYKDFVEEVKRMVSSVAEIIP